MTDFAALLEAAVLKTDKVPTESGEFFVRVMSGGERDIWGNEIYGGEAKPDNVTARLIVRTLCDEGGNRIYPEDKVTPELIKKIGALDGTLLTKLWKAAWKLNKLGAEALDESKKGSPVTTN